MCIIQFIISFIKTLLVADKRVELYGISIDDANISLHIQLSEYIPGIYVSDLVYRLYCDNPTQVHNHTQLVHGKISMTQIYGTADSHTFARNKIPSPSESLHGNDSQCKFNDRK